MSPDSFIMIGVVAVFALGLILLCVWIAFWDDWIKRHPDEGVDSSLWGRWKRNHPNFHGERVRSVVKRRWAVTAMALGFVLIVWGLSGWIPAGPYSIGGLSGSDREVLLLGAALVAIGWLGRKSESA